MVFGPHLNIAFPSAYWYPIALWKHSCCAMTVFWHAQNIALVLSLWICDRKSVADASRSCRNDGPNLYCLALCFVRLATQMSVVFCPTFLVFKLWYPPKATNCWWHHRLQTPDPQARRGGWWWKWVKSGGWDGGGRRQCQWSCRRC